MKKETLEKGLKILREIDFHEYRVKKLEERKTELEQNEGIKLEGGFDIDITIPFEVFEDWFRLEIKYGLDCVFRLKKELEELKD